MSVVSELFDKPPDPILRLWQRGLYFFWAVASVAATIFVVLLAAWWSQLGNGAGIFKTYGWLPLTVAIGAAIFGVLRKLEDCPTPTVFLVANDDHSFWTQLQNGGRVITQFCFRIHATNLTSEPVKLVGLKLIRPRIKRHHKELASRVITQHPTQNVYGQYPIMPQAFSRVCCDLIVDRPMDKPGGKITVIAALSDEHGAWHKVKFEDLEAGDSSPQTIALQ
jgi:hypothetical protein